MKTRTPWWETTDERTRVYDGGADLKNRPTETEADLIAAAAPRGEVTRRHMAELCADDCTYERDGFVETFGRSRQQIAEHADCIGRHNRLGPALGGKPMSVSDYLSWLDLGDASDEMAHWDNHDFWSRPSLWAEGGPRL